MKIISFAWTTSAFVAGRKTCTRRNWNSDYARTFKPGELVQAWDRTPRVTAAKRIGTIRIVSVYQEQHADIPDEDWENEGFAYLSERGIGLPIGGGKTVSCRELWDEWRNSMECGWVVRFEVVDRGQHA